MNMIALWRRQGNLFLLFILIVVGLIRPTIYLTNCFFNLNLPTSFLKKESVSPLPLVFTEPGFFKNISVQVALADGEQLTFPFTAEWSNRIAGPILRSRVLFIATILSVHKPNPLTTQVLDYYFCKNSELANSLGLSSTITDVTIASDTHFEFQCNQ